jgi:hypothetical protein
VSPLPFANLDRRTAMIRTILLLATLLGLIASAPVWMNTRTFPMFTWPAFVPVLPAPWDQVLFVGMLLALLAAPWFYRPAVITFLSASLYAFWCDHNRGQPWFYMYWVLLLLSLFPAPSTTAAQRVAFAMVYLWGGIQKLNGRFFSVTPEWFVSPANQWPLPSVTIDGLKLAVQTAPFVEIGIAVLLWFPSRMRRVGLGLVTLTHLFALLFLGPLGHNYNWVVWPWNLAMIALAFALFSGSWSKKDYSARKPTPTNDRVDLRQTIRELCICRPAVILVVLYSLLPILSYSGRWDSYFSFSLYSENLAVANLFCTEQFREALPPRLKAYVQPFPPPYDPARQGPLTFSFTAWAYEEMHVPAISEPRNFFNVYRVLRSYAKEPADLRMIIGPRSGPVIFVEGDRIEYLPRAR